MLVNTRLSQAAAAAVFTTLFLLIGWRDINPFGFQDLNAYRAGFETQWTIFLTLNTSPVEFILREGVWAHLFDTLTKFTGSIDAAFIVVSIACIYMMSLYVLVRSKSFLYLLFFLNPTFVDLTIGQLRSGLSAGIFWIAVLIRNWPMKVALLLLAAAIHTAFFLFAAFYVLFEILSRMDWGRRAFSSPVASTVLIIAAGLFVTVFRDVILAAVGDERAYQVLDYTSGILLALAWVSLIPTYLVLRRRGAIAFDPAFFAFSASMALFSALFGLYGSRFAAVIIPSLAVMASQIPPERRLFYILHYFSFSAGYFFFWFD